MRVDQVYSTRESYPEQITVRQYRELTDTVSGKHYTEIETFVLYTSRAELEQHLRPRQVDLLA